MSEIHPIMAQCLEPFAPTKRRITKDLLEKLADACNSEVHPDRGWKYSIEYAYGRPRLVMLDDRLCCRDVSPRLSKGALAEWIWAFLEGVRAVKNH